MILKRFGHKYWVISKHNSGNLETVLNISNSGLLNVGSIHSSYNHMGWIIPREQWYHVAVPCWCQTSTKISFPGFKILSIIKLETNNASYNRNKRNQHRELVILKLPDAKPSHFKTLSTNWIWQKLMVIIPSYSLFHPCLCRDWIHWEHFPVVHSSVFQLYGLETGK